MFIIKNNYYFYIENTKDINLNSIKNNKKITIIYRNNNIPEKNLNCKICNSADKYSEALSNEK